jgi:hypothetical protein
MLFWFSRQGFSNPLAERMKSSPPVKPLHCGLARAGIAQMGEKLKNFSAELCVMIAALTSKLLFYFWECAAAAAAAAAFQTQIASVLMQIALAHCQSGLYYSVNVGNCNCNFLGFQSI